MATINAQPGSYLNKNQWFLLGLFTAAASVLAVLLVQALALAIWPDIALFKPLDSYPRTAVFTLIPAVVATALLSWLANNKPQPAQAFLRIAAVVLIVSIIPDYFLPVPNKTLLASTVTALLHVVAAIVTISVLLTGYRRLTG